jgi:hypothetical protein
VNKLLNTLKEVANDKEISAKVKATGEIYDPLLGDDMEKYYKDMIGKITENVKKHINRYSEF